MIYYLSILMPKLVYGLGLPRTGTNSLARALQYFGITGYNHCMIHKKTKISNLYADVNDLKYIIDNKIYRQDLNKLDLHKDKFILTTRSDSNWKQSISSFKDKISPEEMNDLTCINSKDYELYIKHIFKKRNCYEQLLILDIFDIPERQLWNDLSVFLFNVPFSENHIPFPKYDLKNDL